jgi:predicted dinucleotide-binding enzyme
LTKRNIVIIGAGKLAYSLTNALAKSGYNVQSVISKKLSSSKSLANMFSIPHHSNSLSNIPKEVEIFLLTVPDGEIKKVAEKL